MEMLMSVSVDLYIRKTRAHQGRIKVATPSKRRSCEASLSHDRVVYMVEYGIVHFILA